MSLQNYVSERRLQYFKTKLDAIFATFKVKSVKVNDTELTSDANGAVNVEAAKVVQTNNNGAWAQTAISQGSEGDIVSFYEDGSGIGFYASDRATSERSVQKVLADKDYVDENGGKIDKIKVNGMEQTITNKEVDIAMPIVEMSGYEDVTLRTSQSNSGISFAINTNGLNVYASETSTSRDLVSKAYVDSIFRTQQQVHDAIDASLADVTGIEFDDTYSTYEVLEGHLGSLRTGTIYLIPNSNSGQNVYDEYIVITENDGSGDQHLEKIGSTAIDLTGYVQETDLVEITEAEIDAMFA